MSEKFQNTYRIASTRLQNWDYGWKAAYFVTICTKNRVCYFGDVLNGEMRLSRAGVIANILWYEINNHAKRLKLGEFVVMPNHLHGIIMLNGNDNTDTETRNTHDVVETRHALSLQQPQKSPETHKSSEKTIGQKRFQNQGKNTLSSIVGGYKSAVTKHCNRLSIEFAWQPRFHDHIIRDEKSFHRISQYIQHNPRNWSKDKFHT